MHHRPSHVASSRPVTARRSPTRRRPLLVTFAGLTALVATAACADDDRSDGQSPAIEQVHDGSIIDDTTTVLVDDMSFAPATIRIRANETVTWTFDDRVDHDVRFDDGPASPIMRTGTWSRTFDQPGTYHYDCSLHPNMTGTVEVSS